MNKKVSGGMTISKNIILLILLALFLVSCDFTPRIYKEILSAQQALEDGNYKTAIIIYNNILNQVPPKNISTRVNYQLGTIYSVNLGDYKKALKYFSDVNKYTEDPFWLVKTKEKEGEINYLYLEDYGPAAENYKQLCSFVPKLNNYDFYEYRLSNSYLRGGNLKSALEQYEKIQQKPGHKYLVQSFFDVGLLYYKEQEWAKAIVYWQKYVDKETRRDEVVKTKFLMANAYETMENLKESYDIYYSILSEYPNVNVIQDKLKSIYDRKVARKR